MRAILIIEASIMEMLYRFDYKKYEFE